jgi:hypothetical protein
MATIWTLLNATTRPLAGLALTAAARRTAVASILSTAVSRGMSLPTGSSLLSNFRVSGLGIRTQDFYRLYGAATTGEAGLVLQRAAPTSKTILVKDMPTAPFNVRTKYIYQFTLDSQSEYRPEAGPKTFWYGSNNQLSPDEAEGEFRAMHEESFDPELTDWNTLQFTGAYKRGKRIR